MVHLTYIPLLTDDSESEASLDSALLSYEVVYCLATYTAICYIIFFSYSSALYSH